MKEKIKNQFRQGDVLVERTQSIPANAAKQPAMERVILAHGEVTGHAHAIEGTATSWLSGGQAVAVRVNRPTKIVHQEHAPVPLRRGMYRVIRQREYAPESIRNVAD